MILYKMPPEDHSMMGISLSIRTSEPEEMLPSIFLW